VRETVGVRVKEGTWSLEGVWGKEGVRVREVVRVRGVWVGRGSARRALCTGEVGACGWENAQEGPARGGGGGGRAGPRAPPPRRVQMGGLCGWEALRVACLTESLASLPPRWVRISHATTAQPLVSPPALESAPAFLSLPVPIASASALPSQRPCTRHACGGPSLMNTSQPSAHSEPTPISLQ
jgi:hypothetical protein